MEWWNVVKCITRHLSAIAYDHLASFYIYFLWYLCCVAHSDAKCKHEIISCTYSLDVQALSRSAQCAIVRSARSYILYSKARHFICGHKLLWTKREKQQQNQNMTTTMTTTEWKIGVKCRKNELRQSKQDIEIHIQKLCNTCRKLITEIPVNG